MHWWGGQYGMGYGYGGFFMILFWVLIIIGIVFVIKILAGGGLSGKDRPETAEEALRKRFARGEINKEEFEAAMQVLKKSRD